MLVTGCDNCSAFTTRFVSSPADVIALLADLHRILVFVPGTNSPNGIRLGQFFPNESKVARMVRLIRLRSDGRLNEEQAAIGAGKFNADFAATGRAAVLL